MKKLLIIPIVLITLFFTGCWDVVEINERIFVTAVGLDLNKDPNLEGEYLLTYVYPNVGNIKDGTSQKESKFIKMTVVQTPFQGSRQLMTRLDKPLYFKHMKVIVIGEELFKDSGKMKEFFDGVGRDPRMNRKIKIVVAEGNAEDVLSTKTEEELVIGGYLNSMLQSHKAAARFTNQTFSNMMKEFDFSNASMAPRAVPKKEEFKLSGAAVLKDYKLVGWLGEVENSLIALTKGEVVSEIFTTTYKDTLVSYVITDTFPKKVVNVDKEDINVDINIYTEGYIQEYKYQTDTSTFDEEFLKTVEKRLEKNIERQLKEIIAKLQKDYKADVLGIGEHICKFEPKLWKEVKDDWENVFPNLNININAKVKVRRTGLTR